MSTDAVLLIFGLAGIYLYGFYSIISIIDHGLGTNTDRLIFAMHILEILESTIQTVFLINALKMYTTERQTRQKKPARSWITLLILINLSIWLLETLGVKKYAMSKVQLAYYDIVFWSLASSFATPLAIFFDFIRVLACLMSGKFYTNMMNDLRVVFRGV